MSRLGLLVSGISLCSAELNYTVYTVQRVSQGFYTVYAVQRVSQGLYTVYAVQRVSQGLFVVVMMMVLPVRHNMTHSSFLLDQPYSKIHDSLLICHNQSQSFLTSETVSLLLSAVLIPFTQYNVSPRAFLW